MQPTHETQIFIAGGGPVGLTATVELHRRGFKPRIVDPDLEVSPQSRALAINPRTLDLLEPYRRNGGLAGSWQSHSQGLNTTPHFAMSWVPKS